MTKLQILYRNVSELRPRPGNPRTHSKKQIDKIAKSLERFGFINPILMGDDDFVVAGHGRLEAAGLIGLKEVPTIRLADMSEPEIRAYVMTDNRLAEQAG